MRFTSIDYEHPRRPALIRLVNRLARRAVADLEVEQMLTRATAKTGLADYGDEWFLPALHMLVDSINSEANLNAVGKLIQRTRIEDMLAARLRVQAYLTEHPEMEEIELAPMILIAGMQRTGTTTLQRLLAADPQMRALFAWEGMCPVPVHEDPEKDRQMRMRQAKRAERALAYLAPEFFAVHPVEHDAPEEDVLLLDHCFMSQSWEVLMNVPSYASWLEKQDHTPVYEYLRRLLKVLIGTGAGGHWVLKSPHHAEYLDLVLKVLPEATIVLTHRDPLVSTTSFLSMTAHGRGISTDHVNVKQVANQWVRKTERLMRCSIKVRKSADPSRFIDVSYYDLVKDPLGELRRIYNQTGIPLSDEGLAAARATSKSNQQHRYGRHLYNFEAFGLVREELENRLGFYREEYGIPYE